MLQVSLMTKVLEMADVVIEEGRRKFRPTDAEKTPNRKFLGNEFLRRMSDNFELRQLTEKWCGCWETHSDLVRDAFI